MKVWFPAISAGSGVDVFTINLAGALRARGVDAHITWFSHYLEFAPFMAGMKKPPASTSLIHANSWNAFAFAQTKLPLIVTAHHCIFDPAFLPYKSQLQRLYHNLLIDRYEQASLIKIARLRSTWRTSAS